MCVVKGIWWRIRYGRCRSERLKMLLEKLPGKYIPLVEGFVQGVIDGDYEWSK